MKDPAHRPTPDFEKAADNAEGERQRMMAALSDDQRRAFEKMRGEHKQMQEGLRKQQDQQRQQQVAERMRKHLLDDKQLKLEHSAHRNKLKPPQDLARAVEDHLAGRDTAVNREYGRQLGIAKNKAVHDVTRLHKEAQESQRGVHQRDEDGFLRRATRQRASPEFSQAAKDNSWKRAFEKAAKHEVDRGPEKDLGNDRDRDDPRPR